MPSWPPISGPALALAAGAVLEPSVLDLSDFQLRRLSDNRRIAASSFEYIPDGSTRTINYANVPEGSFRLTLLSGFANLRDLAGNALAGEPPSGLWMIPPQQSGNGVLGGNFFVKFVTDVDTVAFPTPLPARGVAGSLVYGGTRWNFLVGVVGDTDNFVLDLDPGQTLRRGTARPLALATASFGGSFQEAAVDVVFADAMDWEDVFAGLKTVR